VPHPLFLDNIAGGKHEDRRIKKDVLDMVYYYNTIYYSDMLLVIEETLSLCSNLIPNHQWR